MEGSQDGDHMMGRGALERSNSQSIRDNMLRAETEKRKGESQAFFLSNSEKKADLQNCMTGIL